MRRRRILMMLALIAVVPVGACGPAARQAVTAPPEPADAVGWPALVWAASNLPAPPPGPVNEHIAAVAADASGFVAVGFQEAAGRRDGVVWFSADGNAWEVVGVPAALEGVDLVDVAAGVGGFVALGTLLQEAWVTTVIFRSDDGQRWERVAVPGAANSYASSVAGGPAGYVVAGNAGDGGSATWVSRDGKTWERVAREAMSDGSPGVIDPQAVGHGWVALGSNVRAPAFLRSTDGIAWTASAIAPTTDAYAYRLVAGRWGYIVEGGQGSCGPLSSCPADTVVWWSGDGET